MQKYLLLFTVNEVVVCDRYGDQDDYQDNTVLVHDEFTTSTTTEEEDVKGQQSITIYHITCITTAVDDNTPRTSTDEDRSIIESHTTITTSATIYDITTTVVDDIKCTTNQSTIEVDDDDQDHTINTIAEFDTTIIDVELHTMNITADNTMCPTTCATTISDPVIESGTIITDESNTTTIFDTVIEFHTIKEKNDCTTSDIDSCTTTNESTTSNTTSATIYDITTTGTSSIENIEELNKFPEPQNREAK